MGHIQLENGTITKEHAKATYSLKVALSIQKSMKMSLSRRHIISRLVHVIKNHPQWLDPGMGSCKHITVTSQWASCRLKSPATRRFIQLYLLWPTSKKYQSYAALALCEGKPPVTGELFAQRVSNAKQASIGWRLHQPFERRSLSIGFQ